MITPRKTSCFPNESQGTFHMYGNGVTDGVISSSFEPGSGSDAHSTSLLYNLSVLKQKVHQIQSLATIFVSPDQTQPSESTAIAIANMGSLIQELIITASSMMFTSQQMALGESSGGDNNDGDLNHRTHKLPDGWLSRSNCVVHEGEARGQGFYSADTLDWYGDDFNTNINNEVERRELAERVENSDGFEGLSPKIYDIIELNAADLLAKYTHYCQICGKGFKRDANLRMHMRAHGDEYKSSAALTNPTKNTGTKDCLTELKRKYSCPQEGCRWNRKHTKFQPLKSMICVKNHYKRSHCPKMYVCKRCNQKQFSVLSDLRTHEKHCGDVKWQCSCGTTFSRKDKLLGHVALFDGHTPAFSSLTRLGIT